MEETKEQVRFLRLMALDLKNHVKIIEGRIKKLTEAEGRGP